MENKGKISDRAKPDRGAEIGMTELQNELILKENQVG